MNYNSQFVELNGKLVTDRFDAPDTLSEYVCAQRPLVLKFFCIN